MAGKAQSLSSKTISNTMWHRIIASYLIIMVIVEMGIMFACWPSNSEVQNIMQGEEQATESTVPQNTSKQDADDLETSLLVLVIVIGGLGATLHGLTSAAAYIGNKTFDKNWVTWYFVRPFVGGVLAVLFYFVVRAGFIKNFDAAGDRYVIIALSGLVGLFSKNALQKLSDVFETLFLSSKDEQLKDKLDENNPVPSIATIIPANVNPADPEKVITVTGKGFVKTSIVRCNGNDITTTFVNNTNITASLNGVQMQGLNVLEITVFNPAPRGGESEKFMLPVTASVETPSVNSAT